jgi:hypothetical protein
MNEQQSPQQSQPPSKQRYIWPWFVLAAVLLGIVLAIVWMSFEIKRTKRIRDLNAPGSSMP